MDEWNPCTARFNEAHFGIEFKDLPNGWRTVPECYLDRGHVGPHQFGIEGPKFGYVVRIQWADAFPDLPIPDEQEPADDQ